MNQKGIGILDSLLALSLVVGVAVIGNDMFLAEKETVARVQNYSNVAQLKGQIETYLSTGDNCNNFFGNAFAPPNPPPSNLNQDWLKFEKQSVKEIKMNQIIPLEEEADNSSPPITTGFYNTMTKFFVEIEGWKMPIPVEISLYIEGDYTDTNNYDCGVTGTYGGPAPTTAGSSPWTEGNYITGEQALFVTDETVNDSYKVGLGVASPRATLEVDGKIKFKEPTPTATAAPYDNCPTNKGHIRYFDDALTVKGGIFRCTTDGDLTNPSYKWLPLNVSFEDYENKDKYDYSAFSAITGYVYINTTHNERIFDRNFPGTTIFIPSIEPSPSPPYNIPFKHLDELRFLELVQSENHRRAGEDIFSVTHRGKIGNRGSGAIGGTLTDNTIRNIRRRMEIEMTRDPL